MKEAETAHVFSIKHAWNCFQVEVAWRVGQVCLCVCVGGGGPGEWNGGGG